MILLIMPRLSALHGEFLLGRHRAEASAHTVDFGLADGLEMVLQADDGGGRHRESEGAPEICRLPR